MPSRPVPTPQDYNPSALNSFREWLQASKRPLDSLNFRWGTEYKSWAEVDPPRLLSGAKNGLDVTAR